LPIDEREKGHAIHGLLRWSAFRVVHRSIGAARFHHRLYATPGYPFLLDLVVEYRLSEGGLTVALGATNVGSRACVASVLVRHRQRQTRLWLDRGFDFVQIYTGDASSDPARRRASLAVEPMSCAPNAFNSGHGLRVLAPGESFEGRWGISAS
jgi:galactose mutarotase-like enzyme